MMAKKRPIDITNTNPKYWHKILAQEGLSMSTGLEDKDAPAVRDARRNTKHVERRLVFVGTSYDLEAATELAGFNLMDEKNLFGSQPEEVEPFLTGQRDVRPANHAVPRAHTHSWKNHKRRKV